MLEKLYELFGDTLPEKHVFFATEGVPTRAPLFSEFGSWVQFTNDYARFVAIKKSAKPAVVPVPKVEVKDVAK